MPPADSSATASHIAGPLVETRGLSHVRDGRTVMRMGDWQLQRRAHALLLGPSGSGKTTFINIATGLLTPSHGAIDIAGQPMSALPPAKRDALRRATIGLVFQTLRLIPALSVNANLALAQKLALGRVDQPEIDRLIDRVGLSHRAHARPRQLSQGEGQRAAIARALVTRPQLVVADEPTSALDDANAHRVIDLMFEAADATGATLLVATHDGRIADRFTNRLNLVVPA
ncbi:ABC transporter ATP-binding protein [Sandarakinorhabdus cyanobacteriorum]|uniref:ABC transporter ATP-binding protein n=1 Tax=Sandarakinorhabdus cyanobacteriorum TaxID=1981098 RepID=A0A255Z2C6_9SPHN|nr:ATP-binding cassette domain-containing protein [Sandarakinorhabdus cyanobacteriorum]OYQ35064.1 ABC transporter ATP-binding protein [Sandarakinorhabdus cyanobacteriorum]